ncbi:MAG TPA: hypothetical protein VFD92_04620 [Candidatus Binatia bacterium]|nr:hypothetical protein [Candidatus Binatia bacterium]
MADTQRIQQAIRSRIETLVVAPNPSILWFYRWQQREYAGLTVSHVITDIVPSESKQVAMGSPRLFRTRGILAFRIATPLDSGSGPNEAIGDLIEPHFLALVDTSTDPPIRYRKPYWSPWEVPDESMYIGRLVVPWQADTNEP